MKTNLNNIDLGKIAKELRRFEEQWVAISENNEIVASGNTYGETVDRVKNPDEVILFKVPALDYSLAP
ncbi:MAG: hypothetical protein HY434_00580 [Candidatus Liptonbacteria bacterium]|nr:hypothetical protein [Parcubacteria group bacterium]MBI4087311.1 hypothetical protein [Candidatus Liptonbacteria bacterium]